MADLTNMLSDNPNEEVEVEEDTSTWSNGLLKNDSSKIPEGKWTLEDGSVALEDWTVLDPRNYLLYLLQLMIQNKASDIYFTYGEEPALRIYSEVHRVTTAPKLEDPTLEAIANVWWQKKIGCYINRILVVIYDILYIDVDIELIFLVKEDIKWWLLGCLKRKFRLFVICDCQIYWGF